MTKNLSKGQTGDMRSPALQATDSGLRCGADQAGQIAANMAQPASPPSVLNGLAFAVKASTAKEPNSTTCKQVVWFSFFFDGTGNNLYADEPMSKHSNVAKLFRAHKPPDEVNGRYPVYIQGVGTYFPEVGDDGGSALGLGCGAKGEERLNYALGKFDEFLRPHVQRAQAPPNAIAEINLAVFGFSRGAALARAFVNLILEKRCVLHKNRWVLSNRTWPVRIRFMGLFDTVASVGLPMSTNTTSMAGAAISSVSYMIGNRLSEYPMTRPEILAFSDRAAPGADPAPGKYDGHSDWGGKLKIDRRVEEVRHFIAAHEVRNSFPLDSLSVFESGQISKQSQFYETVYPGVHSDVGGSYAPGEGGKGKYPTEKLGLVPLEHMYRCALSHGVPLLPESAWDEQNRADFAVAPSLLTAYNHYVSKIGSCGSLGQAINKNMELYYAWRFRSIRMRINGDQTESSRIASYASKFKEKETAIDREIAQLTEREQLAAAELQRLLERRAAHVNRTYGMVGTQADAQGPEREIQRAESKHQTARDDLLKVKARKDALPHMEDLQSMLDLYDKQLLADVRAIRDVFSKRGIFGGAPETGRRAELRPHYKILVEAYENEFERNKGLTDAAIIAFFENYVHDSLAAFAKDATVPSDPRVVYLAGDEKYKYADLSGGENLKDREIRIA